MKHSFLYDDEFYKDQIGRSYKSACIYAKHLLKYIEPISIVDIGCGRGTWLKAFKEFGVSECVGMDGKWNSQAKMITQDIDFIPIDLTTPKLNTSKKWDLAISLEVAEHLPKHAADEFINFLTSLSNVVMFSAAYINQGGDNHLNEELHSYWAIKFKERGYNAYDLFRPYFWGDDGIDFCYRQNTFLYVKNTSRLNIELEKKGIKQIDNIDFMNCIHPYLYLQRSSLKSIILRYIGLLTPQRLRSITKSIIRKLK